ncbi:2321_t:CDS:2, partial [Gigaspora rosea]
MADQDFKSKLQFEDPAEVEELYLDKRKIVNIANITSTSGDRKDFTPLNELINLKLLSLNCTQLHSLDGFPPLPKLKRLALSDNKIVGGLEILANAKLENLNHLDLSNNRIVEISALEPLRALPNLKHLTLVECPVTQIPNYREAVFEIMRLNGRADDSEEEENQEVEVSEEEVGSGSETNEEIGDDSNGEQETNANEEVSDSEEEQQLETSEVEEEPEVEK